jgi:hypothetical protein
MWKCLNCSEDVPDNLAVCWNCEADKLGVVPSVAEKNDESELKQFLSEKHRPKNCIRCNSALTFTGTKAFREGTNWGMLGDFGEFFDGHLSLEMYVCPKCLRVEFFVSEPDV